LSKPPASREYLAAYYRGVFFATAALKGRIAKLGRDFRPAVEEITAYQGIIKRFMAALEETERMHRERESGRRA
jgi:hypothetical protein